MAAPFQFVQEGQCPQLLIGSASAAEQGYVVAVLSAAKAGLGPYTIGQLLADTSLAGVVFLREPLQPGTGTDLQAQFVKAVVAHASGQPVLLWGASADAVIKSTGLVRVQLKRRGATLTTSAALNVAVTSTLTVTADAGMTLGGGTTAISLTGQLPVGFSGPSAPGGTDVVHGASLPCAGSAAGCLEFAAYIPQSSLAAMNWGFAIGFPVPDGGSVPGLLIAPLAAADATSAGFTVDIDPLDGTRPQPVRSALTFTGTNLDGTPTVLQSAYTTASGGQAIALVPVTAAAGAAGTVAAQLVITYPPITTGGLPPYMSLAPAGDFVLSTASGQPVALLCGLQGTEYLVMQPRTSSYSGDFLRFVPGQAAFVPQLPLPVASPVGPPAGGGPLTDDWTMSWALAMPGAPVPSGGQAPAGGAAPSVRAVAQPSGFSLYGLDGLIHPSNPNLLGPAGLGQVLSATPAAPFPLIPYGLVTPGSLSTTIDAATVTMLEAQVVAPLRHAALSADALPASSAPASSAPVSPAPAAAATTALQAHADVPASTFTTPSGYLVSATASGNWESILLGTLLETSESFQLLNPGAAVQQAFQAGQLFLVVANDADLGTLGSTGADGQPAFANSLTIGGWGMEASVGQGCAFGDYANVLIIKGMPGPLYDPSGPPEQNLVANPGKWTSAERFAAPATVPAGSTTPAPDPSQLVNLSQWLQDYFAAAVADTDTQYFASFNALAADPDWTGVLVLRGAISAPPAGLAGIMAGVAYPQLFNVHHMALNLTPVALGPSGPAVSRSTSVSGLIYYADPGVDPAAPQPVMTDPAQPYGFRLLTLKVLFENSAVQSFSSYCQLTLRNLFGSPISGMGAGGNSADAILLTGSFHLAGGQPVYSMASTADAPFLLSNAVLQRVEITGAQMSTVSPPGSSEVISAFSMTGYLDFAIVPGGTPVIDLFGFGNAAGATLARQGVSFSNLVLTMQFAVPAPGVAALPAFSPPDDGSLRIDLATSTVRQGSLVDAMALQLSGVPSFSGTPADAGYLPVIGLVPGGSLGGSWHGLVLDVNLGTPGKLASSAGLKATLLLAWSPAPGSAQVQVGLSLPGTAQGAPLISLQNVLKLSIGQIQLVYDGTKGEYVLLLDEIALTFLGLLKIPPNGSTSFYLFGEGPGSTAGLGWYAVYSNEPAATAPSQQSQAVPR